MDPDVSVCALPVLLVSLCEEHRAGVVSAGPVSPRTTSSTTTTPTAQRRGPRPCCQGGPAPGTKGLLLPGTLLLLLLGLVTCLVLLRRALLLGTTRARDPSQRPDQRREQEEGGGGGGGAGGGGAGSGPPGTQPTGVSSSLPILGSAAVPTPSPAPHNTPCRSPSGAPLPPSAAPPAPVTTTLSPGSGHARRCNDTEKAYCVNGGDCYFIHGINQLSCKCPDGYFGPRCLQTEPLRLRMPNPFPTQKSLGIEFMEAEELYQKRVLTITGICVALLVVGIVCVVAYCKTKKQKKKMHNHLRQNMCVDHPNRNLANGPNHPGPAPEEIPLPDYISKNVPATERIIQHGAAVSFPGSRASSRSHNSSTHAHSSTQRYQPYLITHSWSQRPASLHHPPWLYIRHEERTWSLERTDSIMSDSPGMMSSSVGTSKCSSPACMEARARRAAHCGYSEAHRGSLQYGDSFDSLGDSPHSDRYVSALTTPARLSPVDFHYSLPPQVPTFQITSPNASHAMSLPPAAHTPYPLEDDQPLLRRYQVPLHDAQRQDSSSYRQQQQQQRRTYLNDSTGSLPSSPYRLAEDDDYETTQEYLSSLEQPKRSTGGARGGGGGGGGGGSRRWRRSRLNGHVSPRGYDVVARDSGSRSCLSDSESEEEEEEGGESTPFLSMQNMNAAATEPSTIYRPADTRTSHTSGRHSSAQRGNTQTRLTHSSRSKADNAPH